MYFDVHFNSIYFVYLSIFGSHILNWVESKTSFELLVKLLHKLLDWFESLMMNRTLRSVGAAKNAGRIGSIGVINQAIDS